MPHNSVAMLPFRICHSRSFMDGRVSRVCASSQQNKKVPLRVASQSPNDGKIAIPHLADQNKKAYGCDKAGKPFRSHGDHILFQSGASSWP